MVLVDRIFFDREAVWLIRKSGEQPGPLLSCFCKRSRRVDSDDLHFPAFGKAMQKREERRHRCEV